MRAWQFSKPKGPGFGIARDYYLTVLASKATLPPIVVGINPKGEGGGVAGFGVPLATDAQKVDLARPIVRGQYGLASPDRKTVVRMRVLSKEEAGFDPEPFLRSPFALQSEPELVARVRATWTLMQLTFETYDPAVYPALRFFLSLAARFADISEGVVADPISQRYSLPSQVIAPGQADERIDARDFVQVFDAGGYCFTMGMRKFVMPEVELRDVPPHQIGTAKNLLISLAQKSLLGSPVALGMRIGGKPALEVASGGLDRGRWEGIACVELIPERGASVEQCLANAL